MYENVFLYYKTLGDKSLQQISAEEEMHFSPNENDNSLAILIQHMYGNMLSRWTNLLTEDGEKPTRNRDLEFENQKWTKEELIQKWEQGWKLVFSALDSIEIEDLNKIIYVRNEPHTVEEAILRQLAHYSYHVGQIVYLVKMIKGQSWSCLTIPKNKSKEYNQQKGMLN